MKSNNLLTQLITQINQLTSWLIQNRFSDDENFPFTRQLVDGTIEITFEGHRYVNIAMKNRSYQEIYEEFTSERVYNVKMLDGALIQLMYQIRDDEIIRHRLAMFPSPDLELFRNEPEVYLVDDIYADVVARNVFPTPVRFDFDSALNEAQQQSHPFSHLTLGQFENCRIPVSSALTPFWFIHFVLSNFYNTAFTNHAGLPSFALALPESIREDERNVVHLVIPN